MDDGDGLAERFVAHTDHLRAVAYRMLGSLSEADDAVQEAWLRMSRADTSDVTNLRGWLTTVVARICLDMMRTRRSRREEPLDVHVPDAVVRLVDETAAPEDEAMLADSVGLALLTVLETLAPQERLAFVLHDMFGVPFDEIGPLVGRSPAAARQLASRARRRVRGTAQPDVDLVKQRRVVDAFLAAAREGDFEGLLAVLDPDVVLRADVGAGGLGRSKLVRGAAQVAAQATAFNRGGGVDARTALVNGAAGAVGSKDGVVVSVLGFTVVDGKIVEIDVLGAPERLRRLDLALDG